MDQLKDSGSLTADGSRSGVRSKPMSGPTTETIKTKVADKLNTGAGIIRRQVEHQQCRYECSTVSFLYGR